MSDQRQKIQRLISSPFRALRNRPPPESAGSSRTVAISPDDSQVVNVNPNQRQAGNTADPHGTTAMISDVERLHISGGKFIQNINHHHDDPLKHIAFHLPRSRDAAFSASINLDNLSRRRCTRGTRVDIIAQIMAWVNEDDPAKAPPVYWLTGLAGLGKTTIAYTICELLEEAQLPFASFFCSFQLDSRNPKVLVTTLCRDLAELYKSYAASVLAVLETNSKVVDSGLQMQIDQLLAKPWQASILERKDGGLRTPIVIVDALDENDRGCEFLEELLRIIRTNQLGGIKFLVTSRPDPKIVAICKSFPPNAVCKLHEVDTANVQSDIEKYLREALPELKDVPELALLSQRAGGLFIYATTAVKCISPLHTPRSVSEMRPHLEAMVKPGPWTSHADGGEELLVDELYNRILGFAFRDVAVRAIRLRILHTIICAESRVDIPVLADLTKTDHDRVVESLYSVLFISSKDGCVYWYHASFPDFLSSRTRARISLSLPGNYRRVEFDAFCDGRVHHGVLAERCLSVMYKSLHFNMCNLPSSYIFDYEVPGLNVSVDKKLSHTLRYASRQWARHLLQAVPAEDDSDDLLCGLKDFLDTKLLFWIEAMNLIGAETECSSLLEDAATWVEKGSRWPDLLEELEDAVNFSIFFAGSPASESTPHLYVSALSMWNQDSPIWRNWKKRFGLISSIILPSATITIPLLTIHTGGPVDCIAVSSDGNQIVSSSYEVWDAKTGKLLMQLQGGTLHATSIAFSPNGNRIVSSSGDHSVRVWDAKTGEQLRELQGHTKIVSSVAFSADGHQIVSGSWDDSVRMWDAKTGEQLRENQATAGITSIAFSPDGSRIVFGSGGNSVQLWDAKTGKLLKELQGHTDSVASVAFLPDGNRIISGSLDKSVRVWDAKLGELLRKLQGLTDRVDSVAFSLDGNRIAFGSRDKSVQVWDTITGKQLRKMQGHTRRVTSVAFLSDSYRIVSGSYDNSLRVWASKIPKQQSEIQGHHTSRVTSVAFSPDGNRIVSSSQDESVRVWDTKTGEQLRELQGHTDRVTSVTFSPDGNRIASGSYDKSVRVWDAKTGELLWELRGHTNIVMSTAFSPDGYRIASGSLDESVRVWDAKTGELLRVLQGHTGTVSSVTFSPDGNRIASGSWDKSVGMWNAKTGEQLRELRHTDWVTSVAFSPDGNQIISGSWDVSVRVWDAMTGELLRELQGHTNTVGSESVAFSPAGDRIISASGNSVRVWDAKTGKLLRELQGHNNVVNSVAFSPDGNRIVSGAEDNSVRVWANLNVDPLWVLDENGWIVSGTERLVWVPSTIRNVLLRPHNTLIMSENGSATISFAQCKLGTFWHECYTP